MDYEKWKFFRNDMKGFTQEMGMVVTEVSNGYAKMELALDERHGNPIGSVHGGLIYALADSVGGVAAASKGSYITTVSGNINYLNAAIGAKKLIADTKEVKVGKNILVYDVYVKDETDKLIATATMTYYSLHKEIVL